MLAGMAAGAFAVQTLHAQAKSPVYMIGLNEVTDADRYSNEYLRPAQASIKAHGGVYVAAGPGTLIEGTLPKEGVFILRWDSMEALKVGCAHFHGDDPRREVWNGKWPGEEDCERLGFYSNGDQTFPI